LKKARDQDAQAKSSESVKKRIEIDTRIMGKITREQITVRRQDEAKRDRLMANRKEEDLARYGSCDFDKPSFHASPVSCSQLM